jgi:hypothetical protein
MGWGYRQLARAVGIPRSCVAGLCCTTRRLNAHRTAERMLLYPWHPWSGLSVHVHDVTERGNATAFRCSLAGHAGRCLEVPAWMFEQEACVPVRLASQPRVGVGALSALRRLLTEVSGCRRMGASSLAAEGDFPDQNRGEVHATPPRPPGKVGKPSSAIRSVRPAADRKRPSRGDLVGAARGGTAEPDRLAGAPAARARGQSAARRRSP